MRTDLWHVIELVQLFEAEGTIKIEGYQACITPQAINTLLSQVLQGKFDQVLSGLLSSELRVGCHGAQAIGAGQLKFGCTFFQERANADQPLSGKNTHVKGV